MSRLWTPQPRNTNNSRAALETTPLSEVIRRARERRQRAPANSIQGRQRTVTSPVTNGVSATTEENSEQTEVDRAGHGARRPAGHGARHPRGTPRIPRGKARHAQNPTGQGKARHARKPTGQGKAPVPRGVLLLISESHKNSGRLTTRESKRWHIAQNRSSVLEHRENLSFFHETGI